MAKEGKKRRINKKGIILITAVLIIILVAVFFIFLNNKNSDGDSKKVEEVKTVDKIKGFDYELKENETKYYKKLFKELKTTLEADNIDENKYAELVAELFVADFYNLDNKVSKSDIGGTQFVYKDFRSDFEKVAKTTMYKQVQSNVYGERKQELPEVSKVTATVTNTTFKYASGTDEKAYSVAFEIEYTKDLGYQAKGTITLIHNDKNLEIASLE